MVWRASHAACLRTGASAEDAAPLRRHRPRPLRHRRRVITPRYSPRYSPRDGKREREPRGARPLGEFPGHSATSLGSLRFLDAAVSSIEEGGLLMVTCTDMAVLCASYPEVYAEIHAEIHADICAEIHAEMHAEICAEVEPARHYHALLCRRATQSTARTPSRRSTATSRRSGSCSAASRATRTGERLSPHVRKRMSTRGA